MREGKSRYCGVIVVEGRVKVCESARKCREAGRWVARSGREETERHCVDAIGIRSIYAIAVYKAAVVILKEESQR